MASKKYALSTSSPLRPVSPTLSAVRSSPLSSGSLDTFPVTTSSFQSSPVFSSTRSGSPHSPDLFDDFVYTTDMAPDFQRIDAEGLRLQNDLPSSSPPSSPPPDQRTWVVFRGKIPGLYDYPPGAAMQTQGYSDAFQRTYPSYELAEAAWIAYTRDGTYPDYGRGPWVVFHGRKPGVFERVTELECSVKGFAGAIFRSCSSTVDGNIKFQLFTQRIAEIFAGPDPFPTVDVPISLPAGGNSSQKKRATQSTPTPAGRNDSQRIRSTQTTPTTIAPNCLQPVPQVAESSKSALKRTSTESSLISPMRRLQIPRAGDGWYVVHSAVLPGVYCGSTALREAKPKPGGFQCAADEESANDLFHHFAINGMVTWIKEA